MGSSVIGRDERMYGRKGHTCVDIDELAELTFKTRLKTSVESDTNLLQLYNMRVAELLFPIIK